MLLRRMKDPQRGTARVVSCSAAPPHTVWATCRMELVVEARGMEPVAVPFRGLVRIRRWPQPGLTLPVTVDRARPERLKIDWDAVPTGAERGRQAAEALAAALRDGTGAEGTHAPSAGPTAVTIAGGDAARLTDEQRRRLRALGIDVPEG